MQCLLEHVLTRAFLLAKETRFARKVQSSRMRLFLVIFKHSAEVRKKDFDGDLHNFGEKVHKKRAAKDFCLYLLP